MTLSLSDIATFLTAIVALAGLILSIYNFYVDRRDKSTRLVAKISNGFLTNGPDLSDIMLLLEIENHGQKMVKIEAVEIILKKKKLVFFGGIEGTNRVPFELQSGDKATFWTPIKNIAWTLKKNGHNKRVYIKACFRTAIGSEFTSKNFSIDISEWTKSE